MLITGVLIVLLTATAERRPTFLHQGLEFLADFFACGLLSLDSFPVALPAETARDGSERLLRDDYRAGRTPRRPSASKWRISKAFRCGLEILTCNLEIEHQLQGDGSTFDSSYAFKSNRWEECVRKMARSAPRPPFGLPLSFSQAGKTLIFTPVRESSGESGLSQGGDRLCGVGAAAAGALTASTRQGARPHQPLWKS
jgi:hypothetical protein